MLSAIKKILSSITIKSIITNTILTAAILWTGPTFSILGLQSVSAPVFFDAPSPACSDCAEPRERSLHHRWRGHAFRSKQVRASISQKPQSGTSGYGEEILLGETDQRDRNKLDPRWNVRGMELFIFFKDLIGFKWTFLNASNNSSKNGQYETTTKARLLRSQKLKNANIENIEKPSRDKIRR